MDPSPRKNMNKDRADKVLVARKLANSREKAQALIMAGLVFSAGRRIEKSGQLIALDTEIVVQKKFPYVGRGGLKLEEALDVFQISIAGKIAADVGSSTGGFTDCLLQRGASKVYAVDVDTRQLDSRLREDPRVVLIEKNARFLARGDFSDAIDLVTMDVSFISILKILPALRDILWRGHKSGQDARRGPALLLSLIKPQFEVGKGQVGKKGIVRETNLHEEVLQKIAGEAAELGFKLRALTKCSVRGQKGNCEFFGLWSLEGLPPAGPDMLQWIKEVARDEKS
jgi:23S rRNA (cytidine1920-2'-O)/16S rRNA (cytidine1409-2'-O)-methyltransferase